MPSLNRLTPALVAAAMPLVQALDFPIPSTLFEHPLYGFPDTGYDCDRSQHPNPVVFLHGLSANHEVDLNQLADEMKKQGYCGYSKTYGAHSVVDWIGGVTEMRESAKDIAAFIKEVKDQTGADKVDIVGHSEGGVMALYVPMTQDGIADIVEHTVALGPAVHGAEYFGFTDLWYIGGDVTRTVVSKALDILGVPAADDMAPDGAIYNDFKDAERIVPEGVKATIIMSHSDTLVPANTSIVEEDGVRNLYVQDKCPDDEVGHAGLAWDKSVWGLVFNAITEDYEAPFECEQGLKF